MRSSLLLALLLSGSSAGAEVSWWHSLGQVQRGEYAGGHFTAEKGEELSTEQRHALRATDFPEWVAYEDEFVRLRYPKHPEIHFEVVKQGEGLTVEGGVCTTVDNRCQNAYVLKVGSATYGVFLLQPAKWLDDGICLCGPMIHHAYAMRDRCLVRYSLLPGGAVKKAQVLGGGLRLMAFEWTHLACTREIYEKLVEGMSIKLANPMGEDRLREEIAKRYGLIGKAGWLHPGQSEEEMLAIMGEPKSREASGIQWEAPYHDYVVSVGTTMSDGKMQRLTGRGAEVSDEPIEGSLDWAREHSGRDRKNSSRSDKTILAPRPEAAAVAEALKKLGPGCYGERWRTWCSAVAELASVRGRRDEALIALVRERSAGRENELKAMMAYETHDELKDWVKEGIKAIQATDFSKNDEQDRTADSRHDRREDASALLGFQALHDKESLEASASGFFESGQVLWLTPLIERCGDLSPELGTKVLVRAIEVAMTNDYDGMAHEVFEILPEAKISDPAALSAAIEKLPAGEPDTQWYIEREEALSVLSQRLEKSGD